jgi:hypothetical protein
VLGDAEDRAGGIGARAEADRIACKRRAGARDDRGLDETERVEATIPRAFDEAAGMRLDARSVNQRDDFSAGIDPCALCQRRQGTNFLVPELQYSPRE